MRASLTDRFCAGAKALGRPQVDYFDENTPGLALRVTAHGVKAWTLVFTSLKTGKRARVTLGRYPRMTLAQARTLAVEAKGRLDEGMDPHDMLAGKEASAMTVAGLIPLYLEKPNRRTGQPRRSVKEIARRFNFNVIPVIGNVKLAELHRRDINRVISRIVRRAPVEATRVFEDLRGMSHWAVGQGYLDHNPMEGMEPPAKAAVGERVLSEDEIRTLWNGLPESLARSVTCQRIVKLCLVTAQRVGEVAGMQPDELDLEAAIWTIPGGRSKNGHASSVPLSALAVEIIKKALGEGPFVFPRPDAAGSFPAQAVARAITRANGRFGIPHWTAHDLRRTAVSMMAKLGVPPIVLGHIINHRSVTKAGVTLSVYSHYDYATEKRQALEQWAAHIQIIVRP
jgi:integrase